MFSSSETLLLLLGLFSSVQNTLSCPVCQQPIEGQWGEWTTWSVCSYAYGANSQTRIRGCSYSPCPGGDGEESRACAVPAIPTIPQCDTCGCQVCQQAPPPCIPCGRKKRLAMQTKLKEIRLARW